MFQQGMGGNFNPMMNNQNNMMDPNGMMMNNQNNMMNNPNNMMMNNQNNMMNNPNNMMMNNPNMMMNNPTMMMNNNPNMMMNNPAMLMQNQNMMNQLLMQQQMQQNMWNQQTMMQQQQQQNAMLQNFMQEQQQNFANNQDNTSTNSNFITIRFKLQLRRDQNNEFVIHCTLNDKVSEVISRFRTKAQDVEDMKHEKYIFNAKRLNETLTVAEAGMTNNSIIYVINDRDLEGGNNP